MTGQERCAFKVVSVHHLLRARWGCDIHQVARLDADLVPSPLDSHGRSMGGWVGRRSSYRSGAGGTAANASWNAASSDPGVIVSRTATSSRAGPVS